MHTHNHFRKRRDLRAGAQHERRPIGIISVFRFIILEQIRRVVCINLHPLAFRKLSMAAVALPLPAQLVRRAATAQFIVNLEVYFTLQFAEPHRQKLAELPQSPDHLDRPAVEDCRAIAAMLSLARQNICKSDFTSFTRFSLNPHRPGQLGCRGVRRRHPKDGPSQSRHGGTPHGEIPTSHKPRRNDPPPRR